MPPDFQKQRKVEAHPITLLDHAVIGDGVTDIAPQTFLQLVELGAFFFGQFAQGKATGVAWKRANFTRFDPKSQCGGISGD